MRTFLLVLGLVFSLEGWSLTAREYLPEDADLDPSVPSPESILGWEIGDWRITHDQLANYMYAVAEASDRVTVKVIGRTHEQRPLLQVVFTAPENHADFEQDNVQRVIGGAIVAATSDTTHPIGFGYSRQDLPLFRRGTVLLEASDNPYATPVRFGQEPLLSGFIGPERLDEMRAQPAVIAERQGAGVVVRFAIDPVFRGFRRGTERLLENSLYFGPLVQTTRLPE